MDLLTQGLLGAAAAHAALGNDLGAKALAIGALAGVLPDADVLIRSASDPLLAPTIHRGFTHALVAAPIIGALAAAPWLLRRERAATPQSTSHPPSPTKLLAAATLAALTHGLIDACTSYGTQLLWPFSNARFGWDVVAIVDPVVTLSLLLGVALAAFRAHAWPARVALGIVLAYLALGTVQRERAEDSLRALAQSRGHAVARAEVFPTLGNQVVWRGLYEASGTLYADRLRIPYQGARAYAQGYATPTAESPPTRDGERFAWLASGWLARDPTDSTLLGDARYSLRADRYAPVWSVRLWPETQWTDRSRQRQASGAALWAQITGRDPSLRSLEIHR